MTHSICAARRLLRFSIRTLLLAMLVVAVFLGGREWGRRSLEVERARTDAQQKQAEATLRKAQVAAAELKLQKLAQEIAVGRINVQIAEQELRLHQAELERLEQRLRLYSAEELMPPSGSVQWPLGDAGKKVELPISEYWQRKDNARRHLNLPPTDDMRPASFQS